MFSWWPFKKKAPPLHRALGEQHHNDSSEDGAAAAMLLVEELATKRRVRKRDAFQRNALHVAVRLLD